MSIDDFDTNDGSGHNDKEIIGRKISDRQLSDIYCGCTRTNDIELNFAFSQTETFS